MKETWPRRTDSNHEHASRPLAAVLLHMLQWIVLPFVISGVLAYICTPAIDCLTARTSLPRPLVAISTFIILLVIASLIGLLGVPSVVRELTRLGTDFPGTAEALARG